MATKLGKQRRRVIPGVGGRSHPAVRVAGARARLQRAPVPAPPNLGRVSASLPGPPPPLDSVGGSLPLWASGSGSGVGGWRRWNSGGLPSLGPPTPARGAPPQTRFRKEHGKFRPARRPVAGGLHHLVIRVVLIRFLQSPWGFSIFLSFFLFLFLKEGLGAKLPSAGVITVKSLTSKELILFSYQRSCLSK